MESRIKIDIQEYNVFTEKMVILFFFPNVVI